MQEEGQNESEGHGQHPPSLKDGTYERAQWRTAGRTTIRVVDSEQFERRVGTALRVFLGRRASWFVIRIVL
ncbi:hypothetical protein [Hyphomicrobium sp. 99]|uniref:hypothetical protein n=1 Tax=Hyphomicrobium sp. 99 TaxID=1163419 RepID=UPI0018CCF480|nr:hypothetical protein [Hyphomicrobium sp. 99]